MGSGRPVASEPAMEPGRPQTSLLGRAAGGALPQKMSGGNGDATRDWLGEISSHSFITIAGESVDSTAGKSFQEASGEGCGQTYWEGMWPGVWGLVWPVWLDEAGGTVGWGAGYFLEGFEDIPRAPYRDSDDPHWAS